MTACENMVQNYWRRGDFANASCGIGLRTSNLSSSPNPDSGITSNGWRRTSQSPVRRGRRKANSAAGAMRRQRRFGCWGQSQRKGGAVPEAVTLRAQGAAHLLCGHRPAVQGKAVSVLPRGGLTWTISSMIPSRPGLGIAWRYRPSLLTRNQAMPERLRGQRRRQNMTS